MKRICVGIAVSMVAVLGVVFTWMVLHPSPYTLPHGFRPVTATSNDSLVAAARQLVTDYRPWVTERPPVALKRYTVLHNQFVTACRAQGVSIPVQTPEQIADGHYAQRMRPLVQRLRTAGWSLTVVDPSQSEGVVSVILGRISASREKGTVYGFDGTAAPYRMDLVENVTMAAPASYRLWAITRGPESTLFVESLLARSQLIAERFDDGTYTATATNSKNHLYWKQWGTGYLKTGNTAWFRRGIADAVIETAVLGEEQHVCDSELFRLATVHQDKAPIRDAFLLTAQCRSNIRQMLYGRYHSYAFASLKELEEGGAGVVEADGATWANQLLDDSSHNGTNRGAIAVSERRMQDMLHRLRTK
ncbi:MAG: hypothetical protein WCO52_03940 [bacterium]